MIHRETLQQEQLDQHGWCQVLVTTQEPGLAADTVDESSILDHFMETPPDLGEGITASLTARRSKWKRPAGRYFPQLGVAIGYVAANSLAALDDDDAVEGVYGTSDMDLIEPVHTTAVHHEASMTWGLISLGIRELWDAGYDGGGIAVGHLDTGVDGSHPALANRLREFLHVDQNGRETERPPANARDSGTHGTHTAGTICGEAVDGFHIGVAPGVDLYSAEVIEGGRVMVRVLAGMEWALGRGVRILNMSLGFRGYNPFFLRVTQRLRERNVLPVFAIGNEGTGTSRSPGNYAQALSVGAISRTREIPEFSSSDKLNVPNHLDPALAEQKRPDLVAPGVSVISARSGGGLSSKNGTSMATPHVAGVAALLMQAHPSATADAVEQAILDTCQPVDSEPDRLRWGHGMIDPVAALQVLS